MSLSLEIITPEAVVWKGDNLSMVTLPASGGEIGVMAGHIPLITALDEGAVLVSYSDGKQESIAIDKGYARCMGDSVSVLTEAAINVAKLTEEDIRKAKENAIEAAKQAHSRANVDFDELEKLDAFVRFTVAQELAKAKKKS